MTDTAGQDEGWWREWLAHREIYLWPGLLTWWCYSVWAGVPDWVGILVSVAAWFVFSIGTARHGRAMCTRCLAATPADPAQAVERHRWALWTAHFTGRIGFVVVALAVTRWFLPGAIAVGSLLVAIAALMVMSYVELKHRQLFLWCPRCRHRGGGGGGGEGAPAPVPVPTGTEVVTRG